MPLWAEILDEMRAIRRSMDKIAALLVGEQAKAEMMPGPWVCGHKHATRGEAIACLGQLGSVTTGPIPPEHRAHIE